MRWRETVGLGVQFVSRVEARAVALAAALVDHFSRSTMSARVANTIRAFRLEAQPSLAEWGASMALGLLGLATPLAAYLVFDRIVLMANPADGPWTLTLLMLGAVGFVVAEAMVRYARVHCADVIETHRETLRSAKAIARLAAAPLDEKLEDGAPARAARLEAAADFVELQTGGLRRAVLDLPPAIVAFVATVWLGGWVAVAPLSMLLAVLALFALSSATAANASRARDAHDARADDFIAECAAHLAVLKGAAMEPFMARRMEQLLGSGRELEWRRIRASDRAEDLRSLAEAATVLAVVAVGGLAALHGGIGVGALIACVLLSTSIVGPAVRIAAAAQRAAALGPQGEAEEPVHSTPVLRAATAPGALHVDAVVQEGGERIRFEAPFGEIVAFTAHDGVWMSNVLRALAGLDAPREGEITFAGVAVADYREAHPGAVALVSPRAVLLSGTIMENLTLFGQGGGEAAALAACDVLGLRPEIDRLPRRLDTVVGDGMTEGLSASLIHRLCLARAIALSPRILLLDEPQARLDATADRALVAAISSLRGRMTTVVATSRPSYLSIADRAFAIDCGRFEPVAAAPRVAAPIRRVGLT